MAKKAELLEKAQSLGLEVSAKNTITEIEAAIASSDVQPSEPEAPKAEVAKAGKRSSKALKEEAEKQAKEERKSNDEAEAALKPKKTVKPARPRLERRAKGYRKSAEKIAKDKQFSLNEAVKLAKTTSHVKFDATVELHVKLGVDPKLADQNIRDTVALPAGTGKTIKIAVFTDDTAAAKKAGADVAGKEEIVAALDKGVTDFDILISTPNLMSQLSKYARTLGPRGLMPNPKSGTVTTDVTKAVAEAKAGRVEYRVDSTGIVHLGVGKVSFSEQQLIDNIQAVLDNIKSNKPSSLKGAYIENIYLATSMGPSLAVDAGSIG